MTKRRELTVQMVRAELVRLYPNAFCGKGEPKKPLKLGIHKDLLFRIRYLSRSHIRRALKDYTSGTTYLRNLVAGMPRVDCDGKPAVDRNGKLAPPVTIEEAAQAREELTRRGEAHLLPDIVIPSRAA